MHVEIKTTGNSLVKNQYQTMRTMPDERKDGYYEIVEINVGMYVKVDFFSKNIE